MTPTFEQILATQLDITGATFVEVLTDKERGVLWINVNGLNQLRICQIREMKVHDVREP